MSITALIFAYVVAQLAALCGVLAALRYRAVRVRREYRLLADEIGSAHVSGPFSLVILREILESDAPFRRYMFWMSLYGSGNLMMTAQLVVLFSDRLQLGPAHDWSLRKRTLRGGLRDEDTRRE